jgi:hypothetical protein
MRAGFESHPHLRKVFEVRSNAFASCSEATLFDEFAFVFKEAIMTELIS